MDFDGDGQRDILSGSWPGELYFFKGQKGGTFLAGRTLEGEKGSDLNPGSASVVFAHDWDGDTDLDLLAGTIGGDVFLYQNTGTPRDPKFGKPVAVKAAGEKIRVEGGDSAPCVADWDGDGNDDLLVGNGDGGVWLYRGSSPRGIGELNAPEELVPGGGLFDRERKEKSVFSDCGSRSKICVADYDGDGLLDLLLGDVSWGERVARKDLSEEQLARVEKYRKQRDEISAGLDEIRDLAYSQLLAGREKPPGPAEAKRLHRQVFRIVLKDPAYMGLLDRYSESQELYDLTESGGVHGNVWVFLRNGDEIR